MLREDVRQREKKMMMKVVLQCRLLSSCVWGSVYRTSPFLSSLVLVLLNTGRVPVMTRPSSWWGAHESQFRNLRLKWTLWFITWMLLHKRLRTRASRYTLVHWTCLACLSARTIGLPRTSRYSCKGPTTHFPDECSSRKSHSRVVNRALTCVFILMAPIEGIS